MVTKKSASSASVSILSVQNENGASFVVVFRVVVDPSPFSPSFPFSFPSTATPNRSKFLDPFLTSRARESDPVTFHPLHSFGYKAHSGVASFLLASPEMLSNLRSTPFLRESFIYKPSPCSTL